MIRVKIISEIPSAKGTIPVGRIIEISYKLIDKLKNKVEAIDDPKKFSHYCHPADCHCSSKRPEADYPSGCIWIGCEYYLVSQ